ncbi:MAG: hypothetical protein HY074_07080 [Deltaproteobacteria bacterium]|nr:hypothetical protein [Deltaproteobacteria bacterium]
MIEQKPFLTRSECSQTAEAVMGLMPKWRKIAWPRSKGNAPFYLLGYSIYSCRNSLAGYRRGYSSLNPLLWEKFSWIYLRLQASLEKKLGAPVRFRKNASLPGFHIILTHPIFVRVPNPWHIDFDFELLPWKFPVDTHQVLSFTLPVSLPKDGAALDTLELRYDDVSHLPRDKWPAQAKKAPFKKSYPHKLGKILIQDANTFHRIAPMRTLSEKKEMRITVQGLAVRQSKHWEIFW